MAVHAHGAEGMKRAIRAGVNSIEHGTLMDDEAIALFKNMEPGTCRLLRPEDRWPIPQKPGYYPAVVAAKAIEIGPQLASTFAKAYKAGVKIAFGTDAGVFKHGMNWLEFTYMIDAGMKPMDAIKAATISAADLLGMKDQLGSIEIGKLADIIAVDGDPLKDSNAFGKVVFVMKDGVVYKQ